MQPLSSSCSNLVTILCNDINERLAHYSETCDEQVYVLHCALVKELVVDVQNGCIRILRRNDHGHIPFR